MQDEIIKCNDVIVSITEDLSYEGLVHEEDPFFVLVFKLLHVDSVVKLLCFRIWSQCMYHLLECCLKLWTSFSKIVLSKDFHSLSQCPSSDLI